MIGDEVITEIGKVNARLSSLGEQMRTLDGNKKIKIMSKIDVLRDYKQEVEKKLPKPQTRRKIPTHRKTPVTRRKTFTNEPVTTEELTTKTAGVEPGVEPGVEDTR